MIVTKDSIIGDVLDEAPDTAPFFFEIGIELSLGCRLHFFIKLFFVVEKPETETVTTSKK